MLTIESFVNPVVRTQLSSFHRCRVKDAHSDALLSSMALRIKTEEADRIARALVKRTGGDRIRGVWQAGRGGTIAA
jgi:hypothetical protein